MTKLYLGATDRSGVASQTAWKPYGLNIDGKVTTRDSTDVCRLANGASKSTQADGCSGIDNSFGENVLPIILTTVGQDAEAHFNASLAAGALTNLVTIDGLDPARDATGLRAALLLAGPRADDGMSWAQSAESFDANGAPLIAFSGGFVNRGVFVAGPQSGVGQLTLGVERGVTFTFPVTHMQIVATVSADGTALTDGVVAGIFPVEAFVSAARPIAVGIDRSSICKGSAFESIAQQLRQAAEILVDGTQAPNRDCDGISFGIGFEAKLTTLGPVVDPTVTPDVCAPDSGAQDAASESSDAGVD
jgi:hypothetical protein